MALAEVLDSDYLGGLESNSVKCVSGIGEVQDGTIPEDEELPAADDSEFLDHWPEDGATIRRLTRLKLPRNSWISAEDVAQEAAISLLRERRNSQKRVTGGLADTIVRRRVVDALRIISPGRKKRHAELKAVAELMNEGADETGIARWLDTTAPDQINHLMRVSQGQAEVTEEVLSLDHRMSAADENNDKSLEDWLASPRSDTEFLFGCNRVMTREELKDFITEYVEYNETEKKKKSENTTRDIEVFLSFIYDKRSVSQIAEEIGVTTTSRVSQITAKVMRNLCAGVKLAGLTDEDIYDLLSA